MRCHSTTSRFSVVTGLSELACAGIPVIVSDHPTHAFEKPPGLIIAGDDINEWVSAMEELIEGDLKGASELEYSDWSLRQPNGLLSILQDNINPK